MNCEQAKDRIAERWLHGIDEAARIELNGHLSGCVACREEADSLDAMWSAMGALPVEEPSKALRLGFRHMIEAYKLGMTESSVGRPAPRKIEFGEWLRGIWPRQPAFQMAAAAMALVFGLTAGHYYTARRQDQARIAQLNSEMTNMRHLVTLSLLQQQSASDRLRGVSWSVQMNQADDEVIAALVQTLNTDSNVNVRLAAVDALKQYSSRVPVRRGLRDAIAGQDSPLVQIALIDWAVESMDRGALAGLEKLQNQPELNVAVQARLRPALERLREPVKEH